MVATRGATCFFLLVAVRGAASLRASIRMAHPAPATGSTPSAAAKHDRLAALASDLEAAVRSECYAEAAALRDEMARLQLDSEVRVLAAHAAFYRAFNAHNVEDMGRVWSDRSSVTCNHPGLPPLYGPRAVMDSWRQIFAEASISVEPSEVRCQLVGGAACVTCVETLTPGDTHTVATNLFAESASGAWEMVLHHASPLMFMREDADSDEDGDSDGGITVVLE